MTDLTNYLMPPQQPNMLAYDDTQGMQRQRPADPLRWAADWIGQNKDLPAPQFFMDPRALSARNMLHSALNTSANWLDGTRDPSLIGPQEMVSPLGLAPMAGVATRGASVPARAAVAEPQTVRGVHYTTADFDKFDPKQFGGTGDAFGIGVYSTPMEWAHAQRAQSASKSYSYGDRFEEGARSLPTEHSLTSPFRIDMPDDVGSASKADWGALRQNWLGPKWKHDMAPYEAADAGLFASREEAAKAFNAALKAHGRDGVTVFDGGVMNEVMAMNPGSVKSPLTGATLFADNARSSAPGTVVNSIAEGASRGRTVADELLGIGMDANRFRSTFEALKADKTLSKADWDELANHFQNAPTGSTFRHKFKNIDEAKNFVWKQYVARHSSDTRQQRVQELTKFPGDAQSSPMASAPGLAANSTQQDDQGVMSILRRYGLAD